MNPIRQAAKLALNLAFATITLGRMKLNRSPVLVILTYHRVLPASNTSRRTEQPGMAISPESFEHHLLLIQSLGGTFISLNDWIGQTRSSHPLPRLAFAVTFDDGWRDNYQYAYPILKKHKVPATIFLVSRRVNTDWQFWPERVLNLLINHPDKLNCSALSWLQPYCSKIRTSDNNTISLSQADQVVQALKELDDQVIERHFQNSEAAIPELNEPTQTRPLLNDQEINEMAASGLIEFGAHTQHHYRLNRLQSEEQLRPEIVESLKDLERKTSRSVPIFCYPNGDISALGEKLVRKHYRAACTTLKGWNKDPAEPFGLRRFNFHDGNGATTLSFLATLGRPGS